MPCLLFSLGLLFAHLLAVEIEFCDYSHSHLRVDPYLIKLHTGMFSRPCLLVFGNHLLNLPLDNLTATLTFVYTTFVYKKSDPVHSRPFPGRQDVKLVVWEIMHNMLRFPHKFESYKKELAD